MAKERARAAARRARSTVDMFEVGEAIVAHLREWECMTDDSVVLVYWALPGEPDIAAVGGDTAVVTRTNEDGTLTIHPASSQRESHAYGFEQPIAGSPKVDPEAVDIALVPGLAFDLTGTRLGRGAGYYDRLLTQLRSDAFVVGVAPAVAIAAGLPREPHDFPMTHVVTESGVESVVLH